MPSKILTLFGILSLVDGSPPTLWPEPLRAKHGNAHVGIAPSEEFFRLASGRPSPDSILDSAFRRYSQITFPHQTSSSSKTVAWISGLEVTIQDFDEPYPQLSTDESYSLNVPRNGTASLAATNVYGMLRGLETFSQLVKFHFEKGGYSIEGVPWTINDKPRFPHRGLMIDTARHFQSLASIRAIIDSLPYAKLNVLHWHMVDRQSFPFESKSSPNLWNGAYSEQERYTQDDVASIVDFARFRGVRVIVEFDMPGHAASWCKGYPEICPSTSCLEPLNVASNATFALIDGLIKEITGGLFKDDFLHLGGDEVDTSCWVGTPEVSAWLKAQHMTADDAYAYFVKRVAGMVIERKRRPVQWSEVFDHFKEKLPKETIVHVWKDVTNVTEVVALGYDVLRNVGYNNESWYLDNINIKWDAMYQNEPCKDIPTDALCAKVLGGHGEMWGETVDGTDLQQTVWPRLAAIAEKLWSTREQTQDISAAAARIRDFRCLLLERGVASAPVDNADARSAPNGPDSCYTQKGREDDVKGGPSSEKAHDPWHPFWFEALAITQPMSVL